jgi:putative long chain acyl-CoA synthase
MGGVAGPEFVDQFIQHNRLFSGGFVIEGRPLTLADITCPVLAFVGETDDIARPPTVRAFQVRRRWHRTRCFTGRALWPGRRIEGNETTWPTTAAWIAWQSGRGAQPEDVMKMGIGVASSVSRMARQHRRHGVEARRGCARSCRRLDRRR